MLNDGTLPDVHVKLFGPNGSLIQSTTVEIDETDWTWFKISPSCTGCEYTYCDLPSGEYKLQIDIADQIYLDKLYLEAIQPENQDEYFAQENLEYGLEGQSLSQLISSKLFPSFTDQFGAYSNQTLRLKEDV